jgi:hypothetical protein
MFDEISATSVTPLDESQESPSSLNYAEVRVLVTVGTVVELETAEPIVSHDLEVGDPIRFYVASPIVVDGLVAVEPATLTIARVTEVTAGDRFGRASSLTWTLQEVSAVDGTPIQIQATVREGGCSDPEDIVKRNVAVSAFLFPAVSLALWNGFREADAVKVPAGKRYTTRVRTNATVKCKKSIEIPNKVANMDEWPPRD